MTDPKSELVAAVRAFAEEALRDLWVFDERDHEALYLREDVAAKLADVSVGKHVDNERYGYVTRETYNRLSYAEYAFTVRGFDSYEQFRTFAADDGRRVGVFASVDRRDGGYDFRALHERVQAVFDAHDAAAFAPEQSGDASRAVGDASGG